ncbi:MAG: thymidine phosphorylase [Mycobacterium leprae]
MTAEPFDAVEVIRVKRDGGELTRAHIDWVVDAFTRGAVADEQMAALLMAIVWRGLRRSELVAWTEAMVRSGERLDLSAVGRPTCDKHSTGGVGDKVSLVLGPLVAACGLAFPQLSGRALGHTGGTLDKMDAVRGWRAELTPRRTVEILRDVGAVIAAPGGALAPADRKLYALRDVTATVEAIPLIASSVLSKKIAEGTSALVLDVKVGSGAFLPSRAHARELARTMVTLGEEHGLRTSALLTAMDTPLGRACGTGIEVAEAVQTLRGEGPADLVEVTVALAREMLALCRVSGPDPAAVLAGGAAYPVWERMVRAQGGDPGAPLPAAAHRDVVVAPAGGVLQRLDARAVGVCASRLGAGRVRKEDRVSPAAGVRYLAKPGERVEEGQPLLELYADDVARFARARAALAAAITIGRASPPGAPLVLERVPAASPRPARDS